MMKRFGLVLFGFALCTAVFAKESAIMGWLFKVR